MSKRHRHTGADQVSSHTANRRRRKGDQGRRDPPAIAVTPDGKTACIASDGLAPVTAAGSEPSPVTADRCWTLRCFARAPIAPFCASRGSCCYAPTLARRSAALRAPAIRVLTTLRDRRRAGLRRRISLGICPRCLRRTPDWSPVPAGRPAALVAQGTSTRHRKTLWTRQQDAPLLSFPYVMMAPWRTLASGPTRRSSQVTGVRCVCCCTRTCIGRIAPAGPSAAGQRCWPCLSMPPKPRRKHGRSSCGTDRYTAGLHDRHASIRGMSGCRRKWLARSRSGLVFWCGD